VALTQIAAAAALVVACAQPLGYQLPSVAARALPALCFALFVAAAAQALRLRAAVPLVATLIAGASVVFFGFGTRHADLAAALAAFGALVTARAAHALHAERRRAQTLATSVETQRELSATLEHRVSERTADLAEVQRVLQRMWALGQQVTVELNPTRVLQRFLEAVVDIAEVDGGAVALTADGEHVRISAALGLGANGVGTMVPIAGSAMGHVVSTGQAWRDFDVTRNPDLVYGPVWRASNDGPVRAIAVVPVQRGGTTIGALELVSRTPRHFGDEEIARIAAMTDMLSVALANAELVENLRQAEWRFRTLFRVAPDAVLSVTADGQIREANDCLRDLVGLGSAQAVGLSLPELIVPGDRAALAAALHRASAGAPARLEVRFRRAAMDEEEGRQDETRVVSLAASRLPETNPPLLLLIGRDVTAEREMRARLLETERLAAVGELVAGVAHEVNNPLSSISAYAQLLLRDGGLNDVQRDSVEVIKSETLRASQVVKDLLSFARRSTPQTEPVDLNQVVERTLRLRNYQLGASNVAVELALAPDLPQVMGDARQLQQVVLNLITNSIQAMAPLGGGTLRLATRAEENGTRVVLEVADTGRGIPRGARGHVFEPFFTTKQEGEGTGLGLSVSYGIVAAHGGALALARTSASGTTFVVTLPSTAATREVALPAGDPLAIGPLAAGPPALSPLPSAPRSALAGTRVLFVDDEPSLRTGMEAFGQVRGFAVATAEDGEAALAAVQARSFDAVVCDIRMPGMDGITFHRALSRERPGLARRTVFITGDALAAAGRQAAGTRPPTLAKPFTFERLEEALVAVMRGR